MLATCQTNKYLSNRPLHGEQYSYSAGMSIATALSQVTEKTDYDYKNNKVLVVTFLDIEGAFYSTSLK